MRTGASLYFLRQYRDLQFRHGGVGYVDLEKILEQNGFTSIQLPDGKPGLKLILRRFITMLKILFVSERQSTLVFIFPVYARLYTLLLAGLRRKGLRLVCIVADLDGMKDGNEQLLAKEIRLLNSFTDFIVHNERMKSWLMQHHPSARISELGLFDFLVAPPVTARRLSPVVSFAGALAKSSFLLQLNTFALTQPRLKFLLYGPSADPALTTYRNCSYMGVYDPYLLPGLIEGSFGLVWDGDGTAGPEGDYGRYMALISQHKLSLYILSGLPLIIHESAACADFVKEEGIGMVISDLATLEEKIIALPEESYHQMRSNMIPIARRISTGRNLMDALAALGI